MVTKPWPAEGIHRGIDPSVYFSAPPENVEDRFVSKSLLWHFHQNPKRWLESPEVTVTPAMKWGSLVDCLLLTPERFADSYAIQPETYVSKPEGQIVLTSDFPGEWNGRQKVCREWKAEHEAKGVVVMTPEEFEKASQPKPWNWNSETCKAWLASQPRGVEVISPETKAEADIAVRKLHARPEIAAMMSGAAMTQVAMRYDFHEIIHGIPGFTVRSKSLADLVPDRAGPWGNALCDLKMFAKLNNIEDVEREIYNRGYHGQAALYLDTWNALTGEDRERFVFCFQLSVAPYEVAVVELDADAIMAGREWYLKAIKKWAHVVTTGEWTSPWDGVRLASLPKWAGRKAAA